MESEFHDDEVIEAVRAATRLELVKKPSSIDFETFGDGSPFAEYCRDAVAAIAKERNRLGTLRRRKSVIEFAAVDCTSPQANAGDAGLKAFLAELDKRARVATGKSRRFIVVFARIEEPKQLPDGITALAEHEYDHYLRTTRRTAGEDRYLIVEEACRRAVREYGANVSMTRGANIVCPKADVPECCDAGKWTQEAVRSGRMSVDAADAGRMVSAIAAHDAFATALVIGLRGKRGHTYNIGGAPSVSVADIKFALQRDAPVPFSISADIPASPKREWHGLDDLKAMALYPSEADAPNFVDRMPASEICYRLALNALDRPYDTMRDLTVYSGKLGIIRAQEIETLKIIDRICRENGIRYFLAGGSLLGAIRHGGMIPWDDDLDIGMLREDFEKFRRVCPGLVPATHSYESPQDGKGRNGSHYHFDKIRLRNSYFSTKYSNLFTIEDGIFLDIIVYDRTSNSKTMTALHIYAIRLLTFALNVRWRNGSRPGRHEAKTKLLLPFMRILPLSFFHWMFEVVVKWYSHFKKAKYLIDGLGQNIRKGRFPREWLEDTEYRDFDGIKAPVPTGYDGYLRHFYGPRYMELLPPCQRISGHHLARVDLGARIFPSGGDAVREMDIRGELFEDN
jgi:phosphorylcholine metabolism protein LicD